MFKHKYTYKNLIRYSKYILEIIYDRITKDLSQGDLIEYYLEKCNYLKNNLPNFILVVEVYEFMKMQYEYTGIGKPFVEDLQFVIKQLKIKNIKPFHTIIEQIGRVTETIKLFRYECNEIITGDHITMEFTFKTLELPKLFSLKMNNYFEKSYYTEYFPLLLISKINYFNATKLCKLPGSNRPEFKRWNENNCRKEDLELVLQDIIEFWAENTPRRKNGRGPGTENSAHLELSLVKKTTIGYKITSEKQLQYFIEQRLNHPPETIDDLIIEVTCYDNRFYGTYLHPELRNNVARWASKTFARKVDKIIHYIVDNDKFKKIENKSNKYKNQVKELSLSNKEKDTKIDELKIMVKTQTSKIDKLLQDTKITHDKLNQANGKLNFIGNKVIEYTKSNETPELIYHSTIRSDPSKQSMITVYMLIDMHSDRNNTDHVFVNTRQEKDVENSAAYKLNILIYPMKELICFPTGNANADYLEIRKTFGTENCPFEKDRYPSQNLRLKQKYLSLSIEEIEKTIIDFFETLKKQKELKSNNWYKIQDIVKYI